MKVIFVIWGDLMADYVKTEWKNNDLLEHIKLNKIENFITSATELSRDEVQLLANKVQDLEAVSNTDASYKYPSVNALLTYIDNNLQDATYKQY